MVKVTFEGSAVEASNRPNSTASGPVMRSDKSEISRLFFAKGNGADRHSHTEEETLYVIRGRLQVTLGGDTDAESYLVEEGQGSFHPSATSHEVTALEDTVAVSFKNLLDATEDAETGRLDA